MSRNDGNGTVLTQQPTASDVTFGSSSATNESRRGNVKIRTLRDDPEDAEFAARLLIEAFRGKFVFAVGENNLSIAQKNQAAAHRGQDQAFYARTFVAEYEGRRAGIVQLKYKGDREREVDDHLDELGCCALFGLWRLTTVFKEYVPRGRCYLDHIAVDDGFRGRGIGKALMEKAEQEARIKGCSSIYLYVVTSNRAKNLYERQGYVVTSTETCCCCLKLFFGEKAVYKMKKTLR